MGFDCIFGGAEAVTEKVEKGVSEKKKENGNGKW